MVNNLWCGNKHSVHMLYCRMDTERVKMKTFLTICWVVLETLSWMLLLFCSAWWVEALCCLGIIASFYHWFKKWYRIQQESFEARISALNQECDRLHEQSWYLEQDNHELREMKCNCNGGCSKN